MTKEERAQKRKQLTGLGRDELLRLLLAAYDRLDAADNFVAVFRARHHGRAPDDVRIALEAYDTRREPGAVDCQCGKIEMLREISAVIDDVKHTRKLCERFVPSPSGEGQTAAIQDGTEVPAQAKRRAPPGCASCGVPHDPDDDGC